MLENLKAKTLHTSFLLDVEYQPIWLVSFSLIASLSKMLKIPDLGRHYEHFQRLSRELLEAF